MLSLFVNSPGQWPKGVLDPVSACFYSVFFDKWASPGSLGDLSRLPDPFRPPLGKAGIAADDVKIWFSLCFAAPEASKRPFCALDLPTVFRTRFWRSPGSILGAILASKMFVFCCFVSGPVGSLFELVFHRFLLRVPSEICLLRALREKGYMWLATHKDQWNFMFFVYARCRRPRSKEGNKGQHIA